MRMWERQHSAGNSATVSEVDGAFAADCHLPHEGGRIETRRLDVFPTVVQVEAAADTFFRDQKHECSIACGAWTEATVVDEDKGCQLQEGLIRGLARQHAGHPDFWLQPLAGGGVWWQCSCDKARVRPS